MIISLILLKWWTYTILRTNHYILICTMAKLIEYLQSQDWIGVARRGNTSFLGGVALLCELCYPPRCKPRIFVRYVYIVSFCMDASLLACSVLACSSYNQEEFWFIWFRSFLSVVFEGLCVWKHNGVMLKESPFRSFREERIKYFAHDNKSEIF